MIDNATPGMWCVWRTRVTKRDAMYDYLITNSASHVGTYQIRIADADTNAELHTANSFPTVEAAQAHADDWRRQQMKARHDDKRP